MDKGDRFHYEGEAVRAIDGVACEVVGDFEALEQRQRDGSPAWYVVDVRRDEFGPKLAPEAHHYFLPGDAEPTEPKPDAA